MKIAIIGTGSAGSRHLSVISSLKDADPIAVPHRHHRLEQLAAEGFETAPDIRTAIDLGATAAIVASETGKHLEDSLSLLDAGVDILVEKPMAADSEEAHQVCVKAAKLGRSVYVGCVLRFSESLQAFKESLHKVGPLHSVRIECQSYLPDWRPNRSYLESYSSRKAEGGVLRDLIHEIDYAGWIFGWPETLAARLGNTGRLGIEAEELAELSWEAPSGYMVSVNLDFLSKPTRRLMAAYGERGTITWDGVAGTVTIMQEGKSSETIKHTQNADQLFSAQARSFVEALNGRSDSRLATGEEGTKALAICDTARRASPSRKAETVKYP